MSLTGRNSETEQSIIVNDGFFPDLQLSDFIGPYRIPAEYDDEAIKQAVTFGILEANTRLLPFKTTQLELSVVSLTDYIAAHGQLIGDKDMLQLLYEKAVFCWAKAWLLQQFHAINRRNTAAETVSAAQAALSTTDYWLNQSQGAAFSFLALFGLQAETTTYYDANLAHVEIL